MRRSRWRTRASGSLRRADLVRPGPAVGIVLLAAIAAAAAAANLVAPGDPLAIVAAPVLPPFADAAVPLGTDPLGRDVLAGLLHGARVSLGTGLAAAVAAIGLGAAVGLLAALGGRVADGVLMRVTEAFQAVPPFLLALAFVGVFGPRLETVVAAIALSAWPRSARLVRAEASRIRALDWVAAERLAGRHPVVIALLVVLPAAVQPVVALLGISVGEAILVESALAFLGLGDPNVQSWGAMVATGRAVVRTDPWLVVLPGAAIALAVVAVSLAGDALASRLGPRR
jgi:peptide/nickel transport system permease protein